MTWQETCEILSILKAAYPAFYRDVGKDRATKIVNL
ncbi:MAG: hypothetical protein ILP18_07430 [Treponema sp.]|nr:hypothetical protein [Treponema sp.]